MDESGIKKIELAQKSGVSDRMISYLLAQERTASIDVIDSLARVFKLTGWQLIMPGLMSDLAKSGKLERLIRNYVKSSSDGRTYIERVAEREAKYDNEPAA